MLRRRNCRDDFGTFVALGLQQIGLVPADHHRLLIGELQAVAEGRTKRLLVNMPPGSAKSTFASVWFPAWAMARRRNLAVIAASNIASTAEHFSRRALGIVREHSGTLGYGLAREAADEWTTTNGGRYRAVGMGGTIVGSRADLALVDDPMKSHEEADSRAVRDQQWTWFTTDLRTRLTPDAAVVVVMTRWHADDLAGRLMSLQPGAWRVVSVPAVAGEGDLLGRAPGDYLWDDAYGFAGELKRIHQEYEAAGLMHEWQALFQQAPLAATGSLFRTERIQIADAVPVGARRTRAWDLAATAAATQRDPDWTVGALLARTPVGAVVVEDVVRFRGGPDAVEATILATASRDGPDVPILLPQDPGQAGKSQVVYLTRVLSGYRVEARPATGTKALRAAPLTAQVNAGNVALLRGSWNPSLLDEFQGFPNAAHDDQVDAVSLAFAALVATPEPSRRVRLGIMQR